MPAKKHPDYKNELKRLNYTLEYVDKSYEKTLSDKKTVDEKISSSRRQLGADNSQSYIDLMVNSVFQDSIKLKIKGLEDAKNKPYFARIDFRENDKKDTEKIYIGKMSLMKDNNEMIIVDWRAPVSNLYYEARLGDASYDCPTGKTGGELSLKRQFSIENRILKEIFDIDITTNDEFLQKYLGANADNRLKDIVSTIQVEQNMVIRAPMWKPLIVQGAAGSGKTTIALHRIAYLIYTFEKSFSPENFMILAPNRLFLNYISEVLPELGVDRVKQTTFEDFSMEVIGKKFKVRDSGEKLQDFVNATTEKEFERNELIKKESEYKSSMSFKNVLENYSKIIENSFIPHEDLLINSIPIFKYEEINKLFLNDYKNLPMMKRIDEIKKHLNNRLKLKKESLIDELQLECDKKVRYLKANMEDNEERHTLIVDAIDSKNEAVSNIEKTAKGIIKQYISRISKIDTFEYYKKLINDSDMFYILSSGYADDKTAIFTRDYTKELIDSGFIEVEDLAPIMYLKFLIYGLDEKIPVRHIVIDEAQDFSTFQIYVLKKIVKDSSFTILGDLSQGIHSYRGIKNWQDVIDSSFEKGEYKFLILEESYRTTIEIMEAANKVIAKLKDDNLVPAKPVIRHGEKVTEIKKASDREVASDIMKKFDFVIKEGYKTAAVICKTMDKCLKMYEYLKKYKLPVKVITGKEKEYKGGIVIVPSYLAKGLEFDAVMIADADASNYKLNELDIKLLYVCMTRPLHFLYLYYTSEPSLLLA